MAGALIATADSEGLLFVLTDVSKTCVEVIDSEDDFQTGCRMASHNQ